MCQSLGNSHSDHEKWYKTRVHFATKDKVLLVTKLKTKTENEKKKNRSTDNDEKKCKCKKPKREKMCQTNDNNTNEIYLDAFYVWSNYRPNIFPALSWHVDTAQTDALFFINFNRLLFVVVFLFASVSSSIAFFIYLFFDIDCLCFVSCVVHRFFFFYFRISHIFSPFSFSLSFLARAQTHAFALVLWCWACFLSLRSFVCFSIHSSGFVLRTVQSQKLVFNRIFSSFILLILRLFFALSFSHSHSDVEVSKIKKKRVTVNSVSDREKQDETIPQLDFPLSIKKKLFFFIPFLASSFRSNKKKKM